MERDNIINQIELYYQQYVSQCSETLFNIATNLFIQKIKSIPFCRNIINTIKIKYPFSNEQIKEIQNESVYPFIAKESHNFEKIISFYIHWLEYFQNYRKGNLTQYYRNCGWLTARRGITTLEKMSLFKSDLIRPILDFIISQLQEDYYILYLLDRYKQRIEKFESIKQNLNDTTQTSELKLQKDILLYLFDQGIDISNLDKQPNISYSTNIGNGIPDFVITQHNKKPFIIEVKVCKSNTDTNPLKQKSISQLTDYMNKCSTPYGCLVIFTTEDYNFISEEKLSIITIYIGEKKPNERKTQTIKI